MSTSFKTCRTCKSVKALSEFYKNCGARDGLTGNCKSCGDVVSNAWRHANRDRHNSYQRGKKKPYTEAQREWHRQNYLRNKDRLKSLSAAWWKRGGPKVRAARQRSDAKRRALAATAIGTHTQSEWDRILRKSHWVCAKCKSAKPLTKDHILPLSRGGSNMADNLQPLCKHCNSSKGSRNVNYLVDKEPIHVNFV